MSLIPLTPGIQLTVKLSVDSKVNRIFKQLAAEFDDFVENYKEYTCLQKQLVPLEGVSGPRTTYDRESKGLISYAGLKYNLQ